MSCKILRFILFVTLLTVTSACPAVDSSLLWQGTVNKKPVKFSFTKPADKFSALRVTLNSATETAVLEITSKSTTGKAVYESRVTTTILGKLGFSQLFDRLSQMPGVYEAKLTGQTASCSIFIEQLADLEPFVPGEQLGELIVSSAGGVPVAVSPERFQIKHPDYKKGMDKGISTPNGDFIFRLPAGFWSLKRVVKGVENARLVAVSSGRRTLVRWASPPEISLESSSSGAARRIEIRNVESEKDNVLGHSRFSLPAGLSTFTPTIEQLQAFERFLPAEIIDLKQSETPLHLVMLLDSSGSMKNSMKAAIDASVKFIETLPADAVIEVIDFDTRAKPVKASSRIEIIKAVKAIKADGATALRDSILLGLERLKNSPRPALVVFTDGFDANHNDTAPGSKASEKDVFAKVSGARIPIFTIGFGAGADAATLARLADLSGGVFQSADEKSLNEVFARLEATVAREYLLTYKRPQKAGRGIRPVISICVDTSGSMESNLQAGVVGSRREIAKQTLHSLITKLPPEALVQILDFDANTEITQTSTGNRARIHAGVGAFRDGGGTNIVKALEVALEGMLAVPSNRRYMMFLTDEAIRTASKKDEELLNRMLARMKDEKIFSMWIGMVGKQGAEPFFEVAEKSGGEAIVADNMAALTDTIARLLQKVGEPEDAGLLPFELIWQMPRADELPMAVSGNGLFALPPVNVTASDTQEAVDSLQVKLAEQSVLTVDSASGSVATNTLSSQINTGQSGVRMSIDFDLKGQNSACSFNIRQMTLYEVLNGVKAPARKLFAVFDLELTNILPEQDVVVYPDGGQHPARWIHQAGKSEKVIKAVPAYEIGDISRHLFLRWNDDPATPCSPVGWLTADPLAGFGRNNLIVSPGRPAAGKVAFLVSDEHGLSNGAIDYYDSNYGHLSLIIAGKMEPADLKATTLPESPTGSLGSAFSLKITGLEDHPMPLLGASAGKHLVWRLVDFVIESKVQALLDIDPRTRIHLVIPTETGPVRRPLSMVTGLLPTGFLYRSRLTPGSANNFRQAFLLPAELAAAASGTICIELTGGNSYINLGSAETFNGTPLDRAWNAEGNGLKIKINAQGRLASINKQKGDWLVVDATVADLPDGSGTRLDKLLFLGRADLKEQGFMLNSGQHLPNTAGNKVDHKGLGTFANAKESGGSQTRIYPDGINNTLMFAANDSSAVPDGQELRFIAIFRVPAKGEYLLAAEGMPLAETLANSEIKELPNWILAIDDEVVPTLPAVFEQQLAAKLKQLAIVESFKPAAEEATQIVDPDGKVCESPYNLRPPVILPEAVAKEGNIMIEVIVETEPAAEGAAAQAGAAASALSGGGRQTRNFKLISYQLEIADVCKTPFEIVYYDEVNRAGDKLLKAKIVGIWGGNEGRDAVDLKNWRPVREIITFGCKGMSLLRFERALDENGLNDRVHSVALAIPDISEAQLVDLQKRWTAARSERAPDHISLWQWFAHARLAGFIAAQTAHEKELVEALGVALHRESSPRVIVLTGALNSNSKAFEARLDLLNIQPVVSGEKQAIEAFRIAAGMFVSALEAEIMAGKGVFQFWGKNRLQVIADSGNQKKAWLKFAESRGVSERAVKAISTTRSVILFPETPAMIGGQPFWAWLEINPKTWETIGVLETGERGAFVSEAIVQALVPDGSGLALGFWKGVETSVWGMSAFILQGDSTAQAAANTRKLMGDLAEQLAKFSDSVEVSIGDLSVDLVSTKVTLAGFSSEKTYSPWEGYKGFVTGFKLGTSFYLSRVKKSAGN